MAPNNNHRASTLKQSNKRHKTPGGTRPSRENRLAGRVNRPGGGTAAPVAGSGASNNPNNSFMGAKQQRLNRQKQLMQEKRIALFKQKRAQSSQLCRVVTVVPLSVDVNLSQFDAVLRAQPHEWTPVPTTTSSTHKVSYMSKSQKCTFTFLCDPSLYVGDKDSMSFLLERVSVSDTVLLLAEYEEDAMTHPLVDQMGEKQLQMLSNFGHPGLCMALYNPASANKLNLRNLPKYYRNEFERVQQQVLQPLFGEVKMLDMQDSLLFGKALSEVGASKLRWRASRSYLLSDSVEIVSQDNEQQVARIKVTGCLRGLPLFAHSLMHVHNVGPARIASISRAGSVVGNKTAKNSSDMEEDVEVFEGVDSIEADPSKQDSLETEAVPDALMGEQTWPEDDEMPGQLAADAGDDDDDMGSKGTDDEEGEDDEELLRQEQIESTKKTIYATTLPATNKDGEEAVDNADYVDVPEDGSAKERFARYRALQSFRSSYWHPKENLPYSYSKIFQFDDIKGMQKAVANSIEEAKKQQLEPLIVHRSLKKKERKLERKAHSSGSRSRTGSMSAEDEDSMSIVDDEDNMSVGNGSVRNGGGSVLGDIEMDLNSFLLPNAAEDYIRSDQYVTIELDQVPLASLQYNLQRYQMLSLFSLFRHECKTSVVHFNLHRVPGMEDIKVKSKTPLLIHTGFRTFLAKPIFSESNLNCDKHKFARYMPMDGFYVASCIGPVNMIPHSPAMVFAPSSTYAGQFDLLATGHMMSIDPDRIILKKVILTGNPIRVRKRTAVVKHMFYQPPDVKWFKPAELVTLQGLRGHIKESVGTHGLFKALFSALIKQNDQVMLILYKRVFPKVPTMTEMLGCGYLHSEEVPFVHKQVRLVQDLQDSDKSTVIIK